VAPQIQPCVCFFIFIMPLRQPLRDFP
jgi:hypothetical protein